MSDGLRQRGVCEVCEGACTAADSVTVGGKRYHRRCARCTVCGLPLREGTLCTVKRQLFCPHHVPREKDDSEEESEEEDEEDEDEEEEGDESEEEEEGEEDESDEDDDEEEEEEEEEEETEDDEMTRMRETDPNMLTVAQMRKMLSYYGIDVPQKPLKKSEYIALVMKNLHQSPTKKQRRESTSSSNSSEEEEEEKPAKKGEVCAYCGRRIQATQEVNAGGKQYHRTCLRCSACGCTLGLMNFVCEDDRIYCRACAPETEHVEPRGLKRCEDESAASTRAKKPRHAAGAPEAAANFASPVKVEAQVIAVCHDTPTPQRPAVPPAAQAASPAPASPMCFDEPAPRRESPPAPLPARSEVLQQRRPAVPRDPLLPHPAAPAMVPAMGPPVLNRQRTVRLVFSGLMTLGIVLLVLSLVSALALTPTFQPNTAATALEMDTQPRAHRVAPGLFCASDGSDAGGCRPCPAHATCTDAAFTCDRGYLAHGLACVRDLFYDDNVRRVAEAARTVLARRHWRAQCEGAAPESESDCMPLTELARLLRSAGVLADAGDYAALEEAAHEHFQTAHVRTVANAADTVAAGGEPCFATDEIDRDYLSACAWREGVGAALAWAARHVDAVLIAAVAAGAGVAALCVGRRRAARARECARLVDAAERELLRTAELAQRVPGAAVYRTAPDLQRALMPDVAPDDAAAHRAWDAAVAAMVADPRFTHATHTVAGRRVLAFKLFGYGG